MVIAVIAVIALIIVIILIIVVILIMFGIQHLAFKGTGPFLASDI